MEICLSMQSYPNKILKRWRTRPFIRQAAILKRTTYNLLPYELLSNSYLNLNLKPRWWLQQRSRVYYNLTLTTSSRPKDACLPKVSESPYKSASFHILHTNMFKRPLNIDKRQGLERLTDDIDKIFITYWQTPKDVLPLKSIIITVVTRESSIKAHNDQKTGDFRDSISMPNEYASYHDKFIAMHEPLASIWDAHLAVISTVKLRVGIQSSDIHRIHRRQTRTPGYIRYHTVPDQKHMTLNDRTSTMCWRWM